MIAQLLLALFLFLQGLAYLGYTLAPAWFIGLVAVSAAVALVWRPSWR